MIDLKEYKTKKKIGLVIKDLEVISKTLASNLSSLEKYKHYIPVAEIINVTSNSKTFVDLKIGQLKKQNE